MKTSIPTRVPQPVSGRLLRTYVATASVLVHLLFLPVWVIWLDSNATSSLAEVVRDCAEDPASLAQIRRACAGPSCPFESEASVVRVALREEEPEVVEPFDGTVVVTPDEVEEEEPTEPTELLGTKSTSAEEESIASAGKLDQPMGELPLIAAASSSPRLPRKPRDPSLDEAPSEDPMANLAPPVVVPDLPPNSEGDSEAGEEKKQNEPGELILPDFAKERMDAVAGGGGSIDYLKDIEEGDRTVLNRKRSSYAEFFERVKIGIAANWSPQKVYRKRDPRGKVYGVQDRETILAITIAGDGSLVDLRVATTSGLDFLDDEAIRAVEAAVPFRNPPEGLKGVDGNVSFKFGFRLEIRTNKFKLKRYR